MLNRETFLQSLGFQVVSIPYDDVRDHPELTTLRMLLSKYLPTRGEKMQLLEKEILRLAYSLNSPIHPAYTLSRTGTWQKYADTN
jgi:hypothetical protein